MTDKKQLLYIGIAIVFLVIVSMVGCPIYGVYTARMRGKAALAHANYSKEVAVAEARAKMESASLLAQADTIRSHGIARSNIIIGTSLTDQYIHWLWIDELRTTKDRVIYVPTEANMPLLEAGKRNN